MKRLQRAALITELADKMNEMGSWSGETHFQKTVFFLEDGLEVPIGFQFVMYKYGPYSFDFHDDLTIMRGNGLIDLVPHGYGSSFSATESSRRLRAKFPKTLGRYQDQLDWSAEKISRRGVGDLERVSTALFIMKRENLEDSEAIARRLIQIKPHVSEDSALAAATEAIQLLVDAPVVTT